MATRMSRPTIWQLLLCLFLFVSSLQCLNAAVIPARPRQRSRSPARQGVKAPARLTSSPEAATAPRPDAFFPGQIVGVRVKSYEIGSKIDTIHPGIVVEALPNKQYRVSMISNKLPGNPPQQPVSKYEPALRGNISLYPLTLSIDAIAKVWKVGNPPKGALAADKLKELVVDIHAAVASSGGSSSRT